MEPRESKSPQWHVRGRLSPPAWRWRAGGGAFAAACLTAIAGCSGGIGCGDSGVGPCGNPPPPMSFSLGIAVADFNGDGLADVVASYSTGANNPGNLELYLHDTAGGANYQAPVATADSVYWSLVFAGDVNGDGLPDIVSSNQWTGVVSVFLNEPGHPGTFALPARLPTRGAANVAIADMDGDGVADLVVADSQTSLILQNAGSPGSFAAPVALYPAGAAWVAVGDLNGDGLPDVALVDSVGVKVLFHEPPATGTAFGAPVAVWTQSTNASVSGGNVVAIGDLDGDGLADLVITDPGPTGGESFLAVRLQDRTHPGNFLAAVTYPLSGGGGGGVSVVIADLNGDGRPDIVVGGIQTVSVILQDPAHRGSFLAPRNYAAPNGADAVAVADVDGDGRPDIVLNGGATTSTVDGVITGPPGVLLQVPGNPGAFAAVRDLR